MVAFKTEKFKKLINYKSGYTWSKEQELKIPENGALRVLTVSNIQKELDLSEKLYLKNVSEKDKIEKAVSKDWAIVVNSNGNRKRIGNAVFIEENTDYLFASFLIAFKPKTNSGLIPKYFYYWLNSHSVQERITSVSEGTTGLGNLDIRFLRNFDITYPIDINAQEKIVSTLSKVDNSILAVKNTIDKAVCLKKSLMQNMLTGKLKSDGTWRNDDEFYKYEKFGKYPKDWKFGRFKEFSILQRGKDLTDNEVIPGIYPVVKSNGIQIYHNEYFVEPPGVVTGRSGTIGKVFFIESKFWAHNTSLYVKDFKGNFEKYIYYLILRMNFDHYYAGTTVPTLNRNDVHKVRVAIPKSLVEQKNIVARIDSVQNIIKTKQLKLNKLERLKKALMQNLLTGKVRVKVD